MPANFLASAQGCGLHGDFYNGWDIDVLSAAMRGVRPADNPSRNCSVPKLLSEQMSGTLTALPGCNPVSGKGETVSFYVFLRTNDGYRSICPDSDREMAYHSPRTRALAPLMFSPAV